VHCRGAACERSTGWDSCPLYAGLLLVGCTADAYKNDVHAPCRIQCLQRACACSSSAAPYPHGDVIIHNDGPADVAGVAEAGDALGGVHAALARQLSVLSQRFPKDVRPDFVINRLAFLERVDWRSCRLVVLPKVLDAKSESTTPFCVICPTSDPQENFALRIDKHNVIGNEHVVLKIANMLLLELQLPVCITLSRFVANLVEPWLSLLMLRPQTMSHRIGNIFGRLDGALSAEMVPEFLTIVGEVIY